MPTTNNRVREAYDEHRIVRVLDSDPDEADLEGGEIWFRSDTSEWRSYDGTNYGTIGFTADA